jgi:hypothetical protein
MLYSFTNGNPHDMLTTPILRSRPMLSPFYFLLLGCLYSTTAKLTSFCDTCYFYYPNPFCNVLGGTAHTVLAFPPYFCSSLLPLAIHCRKAGIASSLALAVADNHGRSILVLRCPLAVLPCCIMDQVVVLSLSPLCRVGTTRTHLELERDTPNVVKPSRP